MTDPAQAASGSAAETGPIGDQRPAGQLTRLPSAQAEIALAVLLEEPAEGWVEHALCAQSDPEAFFPVDGASSRSAKRVCGICPVRDECLRAALDRRERFGIWGGLTESERRALEKQRAVAIRSWAKSADLSCPATGPIPAFICQAYTAADHGEAA